MEGAVPEPVSVDLGNGKESGGEGGKSPEEVESTLVATPTTTAVAEATPVTG